MSDACGVASEVLLCTASSSSNALALSKSSGRNVMQGVSVWAVPNDVTDSPSEKDDPARIKSSVPVADANVCWEPVDFELRLMRGARGTPTFSAIASSSLNMSLKRSSCSCSCKREHREVRRLGLH